MLDSLVQEPDKFKAPQIYVRKNTLAFQYKHPTISKSFNRNFNEGNFASCAIWILEHGYELLTKANILPRLTTEELQEYLTEAKMRNNYSESDLDNTDTGSKLESINKEFLESIVFEPNRFKVP